MQEVKNPQVHDLGMKRAKSEEDKIAQQNRAKLYPSPGGDPDFSL